MDDSNVDYSGTPDAFSVGAAYPNPFNPSTNLSLELNTTADISVKVFNVAGQLVDVIAEGTYSPNTYNWTWDAENLASGVYLVRTQVGNNVDSQKIMLLNLLNLISLKEGRVSLPFFLLNALFRAC